MSFSWVAVAHTEPGVTECGVRGLQEGHDYMFRVKATNAEGESEPLETDAAIKAKDPYSENRSKSSLSRITDMHALKKLSAFISRFLHAHASE